MALDGEVFGQRVEGRGGTRADVLNERLYVGQDANYDNTALFDNVGNVVECYVYDPFGQITVFDINWIELPAGSQFGWLYLHQGGRFDAETGLYYNRARYLDPTTGRWTTQDPLGFAAGDANLYRYVFNTPTLYTDPSGMILPLLIIGGTILIGGTSVAVNTGVPEWIGETFPKTFAGPTDDGFGRWANRIAQRNSSAQLDRLWAIPGDEAAPAILGLRWPKGHRGAFAQDISPAGRLGRIPETTPATARIFGYSSWRSMSVTGFINNINRANTRLLIIQGGWDFGVIIYSIFD